MVTKEVGVRIRVEKELRVAFQDACKAERVTASDVIRTFMVNFVLRSQSGLQTSLFMNEDRQQKEKEVK